MYGLFVEKHAQALATAYTLIVIYAYGYSTQKENYLIEISEDDNLKSIRIYYKKHTLQIPLISGMIRILEYFYYTHKAYNIVLHKFGKPDLCHVHILTRAGVFALFLKLKYGINYVITEHWSRYQSYPGTYKGLFRKLFTRLVVKKASAVSAVTKNLIDAMKSHHLNNPDYSIINNVVDTDLFTPIPFKQSTIKEFINITCFEDKSKNISGLIKAIAKLSKQRNDFVCFLVGEGVDKDQMIQLASSLNLLDKQVVFTGELCGKDLANRLANSSFLVSNSNYENMPVVISEAFACGLPVLSTDVGGIHEHVNSSNGILIPKGNESTLIKELNFMLDNSGNYDQNVIRAYGVANFSKDAIIKQFSVIYNKTF